MGNDLGGVQIEKRRLERNQTERKRKNGEESAIASAAVTPSVGIRPKALSEISNFEDLAVADTDWFPSFVGYVKMITNSEADIRQSSERGNIIFINERIVLAHDKCKISDRDTMHPFTAIAIALGHNGG